ncbi:hypothetical protein PCH_Pc20g10370 [Penicillium rubens Wisconsin 54-1255]|uniref:Uncharacterized protein n=1 Tax=Penicillium rubens (strain ATCC 28089 / DSM 1075 / NRRL 1951 / Wisconsin 54-1255) TaxID=500485 RepID=B6HFN6_PENRW|nr:hypothetical protein PCH_Pc20g10370 [Penicillium rubens Wisconsin 54-1255]
MAQLINYTADWGSQEFSTPSVTTASGWPYARLVTPDLAIFTTEITYMPKVSLDATPPNYWERDTRCVDGIWENKVKPNSKIKTKLPSPGTVGPWLIRTEPWNSRLLSTPYLVLRTSTSIFTFDVVRARITHTGQGESPEWQIISPDLGIPPVLQFITEHQNSPSLTLDLLEQLPIPTVEPLVLFVAGDTNLGTKPYGRRGQDRRNSTSTSDRIYTAQSGSLVWGSRIGQWSARTWFMVPLVPADVAIPHPRDNIPADRLVHGNPSQVAQQKGLDCAMISPCAQFATIPTPTPSHPRSQKYNKVQTNGHPGPPRYHANTVIIHAQAEWRYQSGGPGHGEPHFPCHCPALFGPLDKKGSGAVPKPRIVISLGLNWTSPSGNGPEVERFHASHRGSSPVDTAIDHQPAVPAESNIIQAGYSGLLTMYRFWWGRLVTLFRVRLQVMALGKADVFAEINQSVLSLFVHLGLLLRRTSYAITSPGSCDVRHVLELGSNHLIYSIKYASQPTGERRLDIFQPRDKLEGRRYTVPPVAEADAFLRNLQLGSPTIHFCLNWEIGRSDATGRKFVSNAYLCLFTSAPGCAYASASASALPGGKKTRTERNPGGIDLSAGQHAEGSGVFLLPGRVAGYVSSERKPWVVLWGIFTVCARSAAYDQGMSVQYAIGPYLLLGLVLCRRPDLDFHANVDAAPTSLSSDTYARPSGMQSQIRRPKHETFYFVVAHIHDQTIPGMSEWAGLLRCASRPEAHLSSGRDRRASSKTESCTAVLIWGLVCGGGLGGLGRGGLGSGVDFDLDWGGILRLVGMGLGIK